MDIQCTLANTFPNEHPEAFILVTSAEKFIVDGNCIQLIGIGNEQGEFDFLQANLSCDRGRAQG